MIRDVAVVAFAQLPNLRQSPLDEVEMVQQVVSEARDQIGLKQSDIGFTCSGSADLLVGRPFSFVAALDGIGAWPPCRESHVEMDAAWALYEAWIRLQHGDIDTALVYGFGKSSVGDLRDVMVLQLDPYCVAPLWPDSVSVAALQARALIDSGRCGEADLAAISVRNREAAAANPYAQLQSSPGVEDILAERPLVAPLRRHDCPPISDGAAAVVLAVGDRARQLCSRPAWIRAMDHRIEAHSLGARDLERSPSTARAGAETGVADRPVDVWELHAPFSHQEIIVRDALAVPDDAVVNPSGGALAANPMMVAGLVRMGEAASAVFEGAGRAVGHATSGPCLQQNMVAVLEGE